MNFAIKLLLTHVVLLVIDIHFIEKRIPLKQKLHLKMNLAQAILETRMSKHKRKIHQIEVTLLD